MALACARCAPKPVLFEEFFELGKEETSSPFLTETTRHWGANITLKSSLLGAFFLTLSFILSFFPNLTPISNLCLVWVFFFAGIPALIESIEDLLVFDINIDILMTLAAFGSILIGSGMEGALLLVLFSLSGSMEDFVTTKAKGDISSLHRLSPTRAVVIQPDGTLVEKSLRDIEVGTSILVKSGQIVPLDGEVTAGISSLNLVHLTGENLPVRKQVGDDVPAGARNMEGSLTITVTRTSADSTLARIIQLVTQAQEERPLLQRWFDKVSRAYAITIISLAAFFALTFPFFLGIPYFSHGGSIYRALAFLIAASPCALIIALPIAYLSAVGVCARQGILLKGGVILDALAKCQLVAFDKTGTLTTGELSFEGIEPITSVNPSELQEALSIAYSMERNAVHPIAKAMVAYGENKALPQVHFSDFEAIPGYGLSATYKGESVFVGHLDYIFPRLDQNTAVQLAAHAKAPLEAGKLLAVLLIGKKLFLLFFYDTLRPEVHATLQELKQQNLKLVMLTGDHANSAKRIATELGITDYKAQLRPQDKFEYVSQLAEKEGLVMIGDGINDAPALARATVGVCMGKVGSTAAIDAADVVLLHDNIEMMGWLMKKANQTQRIVKQNLILASLAIVAASTPALLGIVPLWLAVILHEGGTVLVGLNGLRLLKK